MARQQAFPPERLERLARVYRSTQEAATVAGVAPRTLRRWWRRHGIPTPTERRSRSRA